MEKTGMNSVDLLLHVCRNKIRFLLIINPTKMIQNDLRISKVTIFTLEYGSGLLYVLQISPYREGETPDLAGELRKFEKWGTNISPTKALLEHHEIYNTSAPQSYDTWKTFFFPFLLGARCHCVILSYLNQLQSFYNFMSKKEQIASLHPRSWTAPPWEMVVGKRSFPIGAR